MIGAAIRRAVRFCYPQLNWGRWSFSQCGEDVLIRGIFNALGVQHPRYLDVGAHHPFHLSNTAMFYLGGSTGVNIEANPLLMQAFARYRPKDCNLNIGVTTQSSNEANFFVLEPNVMSTFSEDEAIRLCRDSKISLQNTISVSACRADDVVKKYGQGVDFFTLDVEGLDLEIIQMIDWSSFRPKVICCECIQYSESGESVHQLEIVTALEKQGYFQYADTHINRIFVEREAWVKRR